MLILEIIAARLLEYADVEAIRWLFKNIGLYLSTSVDVFYIDNNIGNNIVNNRLMII